MYYTTSGAYRKSKMLIDYATIALTAVIMILFILILFLRSNSGILFPIVFLAGALINGLSGIKESIAAAYPNTEYQRCIVHQVRNTLKYVAEKDKKAFANDLKSIYHAPNEESGYNRMQAVTKKWHDRYPNAMKRWEENWDVISPMFKFSADVRKVMYTTNAIESLNSALRRLNSQRSVFPSDTALLKALYLATFEATKKWTMPLRNWGKVYRELSIMYDGRLF